MYVPPNGLFGNPSYSGAQWQPAPSNNAAPTGFQSNQPNGGLSLLQLAQHMSQQHQMSMSYLNNYNNLLQMRNQLPVNPNRAANQAQHQLYVNYANGTYHPTIEQQSQLFPGASNMQNYANANQNNLNGSPAQNNIPAYTPPQGAWGTAASMGPQPSAGFQSPTPTQLSNPSMAGSSSQMYGGANLNQTIGQLSPNSTNVANPFPYQQPLMRN